jgi:hypothetical protein
MKKTVKDGTHILLLENDDPYEELNFEIDFQLSLTPSQRYEIMDQLVKDGLEFEHKRGYKNTPKIVTRS